MGKELKEIMKSIVIAIISAALIINYIFEVVSVDGRSMQNTLKNNDKLIVDKITYRFRKPQVGDIIVFKYPGNNKEKYIKRIIAVENDKIKIENDKVYINGRLLLEPYAFYLNNDILNENEENDIVHNFSEKIVPKNTVFVLGDNRYDSLDSRFADVGFVDKKLIIGKATLRIYPLTNIGKVR